MTAPITLDAATFAATVRLASRAHDAALASSAGLISDHQEADAAVGSAVYSVLVAGSEGYADLGDQLSDLAVHIARGHYHTDGNKRTAILTVLTIADVLGQPSVASDDDIVSAALAAADGDRGMVRTLLFGAGGIASTVGPRDTMI